jgi:hypothetical protein
LISVLCPSRGRPVSLRASADSLLSLASDVSAVEILVAMDPDDDLTLESDSWSTPAWPGNAIVRPWVAPERYGYAQLHRYYNHLATMAKGDWLLLFNDDATMRTPGWDEVIEGQAPGVLWLASNQGPYYFPAWPRAWSDAWGHVSLSPNVDVWVSEVGARVGRTLPVPVEVLHDRKDITGGHDDQTYAEGRAVMGATANHPDYDSAANREARIRDSITVRRLLEGRP